MAVPPDAEENVLRDVARLVFIASEVPTHECQYGRLPSLNEFGEGTLVVLGESGHEADLVVLHGRRRILPLFVREDRLTGPEYLLFVGRMYAMPRELINDRSTELLGLMEAVAGDGSQ